MSTNTYNTNTNYTNTNKNIYAHVKLILGAKKRRAKLFSVPDALHQQVCIQIDQFIREKRAQFYES